MPAGPCWTLADPGIDVEAGRRTEEPCRVVRSGGGMVMVMFRHDAASVERLDWALDAIKQGTLLVAAWTPGLRC
jgi:hypothetical protein